MDARGEKKVTDLCLQNLAGKLGLEWQAVGRRLEVDVTILTIDGKNEGQRNINNKMLDKWKQGADDKATYNVLAKALKNEGRLDLARQLLKGKFDNDIEPDNSTSTTTGPVSHKAQTAAGSVEVSEVPQHSPTNTDPGAVVSDAQTQRGSARVPHYKMSGKPLGKCLILTYGEFSDKDGPDENMKRRGNDIDEKILKEVFLKLGFDVSCKTNLNKKDTMDKIQKMATKWYDSFVLFICSHGNEKAFTTSDKKEVNIQDVITPFKAENCQSFAGKPKIFFVNSCRGTAKEKMVKVSRPEQDNAGAGFVANLSYYRPNEADFCVVLSTVPGYVAWRDPEKGTFFAQDFCTCLQNNYQTHHLLDIVTMCISIMIGKSATKRAKTECQVPTVISTLSDAVYFVDE